MEIRLLVVDDEIFVRELLAEYFARMNYQVTTAATASEALGHLRKNSFQVALIDLKMPEVSGVDLLRQIKQSGDDLSVIIMTGYPTVDSAVSAMRDGASDYIIKPFRLNELGLIVKRAVADYEQRCEVKRLKERVVELEAKVLSLKKREQRDNMLASTKRFVLEQPVAVELGSRDDTAVANKRQRTRSIAFAEGGYVEKPVCQQEYAAEVTSLLQKTS